MVMYFLRVHGKSKIAAVLKLAMIGYDDATVVHSFFPTEDVAPIEESEDEKDVGDLSFLLRPLEYRSNFGFRGFNGCRDLMTASCWFYRDFGAGYIDLVLHFQIHFAIIWDSSERVVSKLKGFHVVWKDEVIDPPTLSVMVHDVYCNPPSQEVQKSQRLLSTLHEGSSTVWHFSRM